MRITIDGEEVDFELPQKEVKIREVIDEVEDFLLSVGRIPQSLKVNGKEFTQEELAEKQEFILTEKDALEFGVINIFDFVIAHLEGAIGANEELKKQIQHFADEVHTSEKTVSSEEIIEEINQFFQFWVRMHSLIKEEFDSLRLNEKTFEEHLQAMQEVLKETLQAMETEDWVLVADLLQYEMVPLLEVLNEVIPDLKNTIAKLAVSEREVSSSTN